MLTRCDIATFGCGSKTLAYVGANRGITYSGEMGKVEKRRKLSYIGDVADMFTKLKSDQ